MFIEKNDLCSLSGACFDVVFNYYNTFFQFRKVHSIYTLIWFSHFVEKEYGNIDFENVFFPINMHLRWRQHGALSIKSNMKNSLQDILHLDSCLE